MSEQMIRSRNRMPMPGIEEPLGNESEEVETAAHLILSPLLFDEARKRQFGYDPNEISRAVVRAWRSQISDYCQCGTQFRTNGRPKERPRLVHIVSIDDGGEEEPSNWKVVCGKCFSDK